MNTLEFYLELIRQINLISSILTATSLLAMILWSLLNSSSESRIPKIEALLFASAALCFLGATTLSILLLFASRYVVSSLNQLILARVDTVFWIIWFALALGILLVTSGLGLSGWVISKESGVVTIVASLALIGIILSTGINLISPFLR